MAKIRIGIGSDFRLNDQKLGLGENNPQERLDVAGVVKGQDLKVTGISSFTAYEGFLRADHQIAENTTLSFDQGSSASLSGEIIVGTGVTVTIARVGLGTTMVGVGTLTTENTIDTTDITTAGGSEIECLKVFNTFTPPNGGTNERPYAPKPGELYYNYDFKTIEFFDGYGWRQVDNTTTAGRGLSGGGADPADTAHIDYMNMTTRGNGLDFGDLTAARNNPSGCSSSTRGLYCGGSASPDTIDYVTIASTGNAIDFGNLTVGRYSTGSCGSSTRGLTGGGNPSSDVIDYVEFSTLGNSLDFGDLNAAQYGIGSASSSTRGFWVGGTVVDAKIQMVTIASKGNAIDFGFITNATKNGRACSNNTQLLYGGSQGVDKFIMASGGNSIKFGDLAVSSLTFSSSFSSQTRGFWTQGRTPTNQTTINMIEMSSGGDAIDFGDMTLAKTKCAGLSDSHGGLGGF